jgi:signal transduction histidine kinase
MKRERGSLPERVNAWANRRPWAADLVLAVVLAGLLAPASVGLIGSGGPGGAWTVVLFCLVGVLHGTIAARRRFPVPAFVVLALAEAVLLLAPLMSDPGAAGTPYPATLLPSSTAYLVGAYTVSAYARRQWPALSLAVGVAGALLVTARMAAAPGWASLAVAGGFGEVLFLFGALLAAVVAAWALGQFRRVWRDQVASLAERARRAEAERDQRDRQAAAQERARIARELHDVVAHSLSVVVRQAEGGRYVSASDPAAAAAALATIAETGREALGDMRSLLGVLDTSGGTTGTDPQPTLDDLPELVERVRASGQPVRLRVEGRPQPLGRAAHLAAYRLVQEALTNVVKHAGPDVQADVVLTWRPQALRLQVTDHGSTARARVDGSTDGRGLAGMRERLQLVGGTMRAGPAGTGGFAVVGEIPTTVTGGGEPQ